MPIEVLEKYLHRVVKECSIEIDRMKSQTKIFLIELERYTNKSLQCNEKDKKERNKALEDKSEECKAQLSNYQDKLAEIRMISNKHKELQVRGKELETK